MTFQRASQFLAVVFCLLSLSNCGSRSGEQTSLRKSAGEDSRLMEESTHAESSSPHAASVPALDLSASYRYVIENLNPECHLSGGCRGVGMVGVAVDQTSQIKCTGFLAGPNIVGTSSHCIPQDIRQGATCVNRIGIRFPTARGAFDFNCTGMLVASDFTEHNAPDYAFFQIDGHPSGNAVLPLNFGGVHEDENLSVIRMSPIYNRGIFSAVACNVFRRSDLSVGNHPTLNPFELLADCGMAEGNSGAPVLNARGEVVGILTQDVGSPNLTSYYDRNGISFIGSRGVAQISRMTSLACVSYPVGRTLPESCRSRGEEISSLVNQQYLQSDAYRSLNAVVARHHDIFDWEVANFGDVYIDSPDFHRDLVNVRPKCFNLPAAWSRVLRSQIRGDSASRRLHVELPMIRFQIQATRLAQRIVTTSRRPSLSVDVSFNENELVEGATPTFVFSVSSNRSIKILPFLQLPQCRH